MSSDQEYDAVLNRTHPRAWGKVLTMSGETVEMTAVAASGLTAVLMFQCRGTNRPHLRNVILERPDDASKWQLKRESIVPMPVDDTVTANPPVVMTSNTPDIVPSVTPSVLVAGKDIDLIRSLVVKLVINPESQIDQSITKLLAALHDVGI